MMEHKDTPKMHTADILSSPKTPLAKAERDMQEELIDLERLGNQALIRKGFLPDIYSAVQ